MRTALFAIALAACGGGHPPPSQSPSSSSSPSPAATANARPSSDAAVDASRAGPTSALARFIRFSDDMCKCVDRGCTDRVTEELTRWAQDMVTATSQEVSMSEADTRRIAELTERMAACVTVVVRKAAGSGASR